MDIHSVFLQQPETQHVAAGTNANFSCTAHATNVLWDAMFLNGTSKELRESDGVVLWKQRISNWDISSTLTVNALQSWNNTELRCVAHHGGGVTWSDSATLVVHTSLRMTLIFVVSLTSQFRNLTYIQL